ncbi:hypothetical protein TWF281_004861 [Arthrobotrys megalospora]
MSEGPKDCGESWFNNTTRSTQDEIPKIFCLPQEIRQQIYENVITYATNFIYKSPAQFKEVRESEGIPRTTWRTKKLNRFRRKDGPCGTVFEIAPSPKFVDGGYDTINLLLVSTMFSSDIKSAASHIRQKMYTTVSRFLIGEAPYFQLWSTERLTPQAVEIIQSSRHIFAGYGHNTAITAHQMPPEVAQNITNVFLTAFVFSYYYPRHWGTIGYGRYFTSTFSRQYDNFLAALPNITTLAFACGAHGTRPQIQPRDHYALQHVVNSFDRVIPVRHKLEALELVYRKEENPLFQTNTLSRWSTEQWKKYIKESNGAQLSELELEGRGRYWSEYEHISDEFRDLLVEGTVWRVTREGKTAGILGKELGTESISDFEDPFQDLCVAEILAGPDAQELAHREPIMWEERCFGKACDCGNNCEIYTRQNT